MAIGASSSCDETSIGAPEDTISSYSSPPATTVIGLPASATASNAREVNRSVAISTRAPL